VRHATGPLILTPSRFGHSVSCMVLAGGDGWSFFGCVFATTASPAAAASFPYDSFYRFMLGYSFSPPCSALPSTKKFSGAAGSLLFWETALSLTRVPFSPPFSFFFWKRCGSFGTNGPFLPFSPFFPSRLGVFFFPRFAGSQKLLQAFCLPRTSPPPGRSPGIVSPTPDLHERSDSVRDSP